VFSAAILRNKSYCQLYTPEVCTLNKLCLRMTTTLMLTPTCNTLAPPPLISSAGCVLHACGLMLLVRPRRRVLIHLAPLLPSAYTCDRIPRPAPHQLRSGNWMNYTPSRALFALTRGSHTGHVLQLVTGEARGSSTTPLTDRNHTCAFSKDHGARRTTLGVISPATH